MIGPVVTLGYNREGASDWFRGLYVSYQYLNGGFSFHEFGSAATAAGSSASAALRTDTTITAALPIYKGYGVFGGWYESLQRFSFSYGGGNPALRFKGPIMGVFGSQPVPDTRASLYGNIGVGFLTVHPATGPGQGTNMLWRTDSVMAYSVETGLNYALPSLGYLKPTAQVGFRAQVLQQTFGASCCGFTGANVTQSYRSNDVLWGPTFMIAAGF